MTIEDLVTRCFKQADELGWHEKPITLSDMISLIHSEASEGLESYRNHEPISWTDKGGKPQGLASEFADIVIRVGHYSQYLGIDLAYEIERKLQYNMSRGHRHGGKAI